AAASQTLGFAQSQSVLPLRSWPPVGAIGRYSWLPRGPAFLLRRLLTSMSASLLFPFLGLLGSPGRRFFGRLSVLFNRYLALLFVVNQREAELAPFFDKGLGNHLGHDPD